MPVRVVWIFSLPRSGSSVTAYAAGAPWGFPVADEPLGPWDRTGPPYHYPALQRDLMRAYHANRCQLVPEVVQMAGDLFETLGRDVGTVIVKHPHLRPPPEEFRAAFPSHRAVWVIRNPVTRLNSLYARGWTAALRPNYEIEHFKAYAANWAGQRERVVFEQMKRDPRGYFAAVYAAWEWEVSAADLDTAIQYTKGHYHASSGVKEEATGTETGAVSEKHWSLPEDGLAMYLADREVRRLMRRCGWPRMAAAYRVSETDPAWRKRWAKWKKWRPAKAAPVGVAAIGEKQPQNMGGTGVQPGSTRGGTRTPPVLNPPRNGDTPLVQPVWLFSMTRSGSSAVAYGAAAAFGAAVADEVFGPHDRTTVPYLYPKEQLELKRLFWRSGERLKPEVVEVATRVFAALDGRDGGGRGLVIVKVPHLQFDPDDFARAYPDARAVWLIRNPLHRLNSLHVRGWSGPRRPDHDLADFTEFARRWERAEHRVTYDELRRDPRMFFHRVFEGFGWAHADAELEIAADYVARNYHASSMRLDPGRSPASPLSEERWALPEAAVRAYLDDPFAREFIARMGWDMTPANVHGATG